MDINARCDRCAQPAYVAPGGIAIGAGAGPVFVTPGVPINRAAAHVGPVADYAPSYEYGPGRRYSYGYGPRHQYDGPLPRSEPPPRSDYGYGPPPHSDYGYGPGRRYDYGYGPGHRYNGPPPRSDYGYGPPPRHGYGDGPGPRYDYGYGPAPRGYGYGPPPRYRRPARTSAHTPNGDAAKPQPLPHIPAPFAGQQ